jgi:hypothetical protein
MGTGRCLFLPRGATQGGLRGVEPIKLPLQPGERPAGLLAAVEGPFQAGIVPLEVGPRLGDLFLPRGATQGGLRGVEPR